MAVDPVAALQTASDDLASLQEDVGTAIFDAWVTIQNSPLKPGEAMSKLEVIKQGVATVKATVDAAIAGESVLASVTCAALYWDDAGKTGTVTLTDNADPSGVVVNLSVDDETIATVPATVAVLDGNSSATFAITPLKPGSVTITAESSGITKTCVVAVKEATLASVAEADFNFRTTPSVTGTVTLSGAVYAAAGVAVALSSSDENVVTVPATATVAQGDSTKTYTVTGVGIGTSTITASLAGSPDATDDVTTTGEAVLVSVVCPDFATATETATITVDDTVVDPDGLVCTLASSDEGVFTVPATATVAFGDTTKTFTVTKVAAGTATLSVNAPGSTEKTDSVTVS